MRPGLLPFLQQARHVPVQHVTRASLIYVLGNQSADLDSIISAIIYSYFMSGNRASRPTSTLLVRPYVPLVNLPTVPARAIWRQRPEFARALWLSTKLSRGIAAGVDGLMDVNETTTMEQLVAEHVLTVADLRGQFEEHRASSGLPLPRNLDVMMVDWNSFPVKANGNPGRGAIDGLPGVEMAVVGCIDHHTDESFVPPAEFLVEDQPRIIQPGPGSCTSLVIRELRDRGLWLDSEMMNSSEVAVAVEEAQAAQLALAAILLDTSNLTAEGKVTDADLAAVSFLETKVEAGYRFAVEAGQCSSPRWNRAAFFEEIRDTQQNSLNFLTIEEILGKDYKDWTETSSSSAAGRGCNLKKIGICSVVKPITWLIEKTQTEVTDEVGAVGDDSSSKLSCGTLAFLEKLQSFAKTRGLDVIAIMTAFNAPEVGTFKRELMVWALNESSVEPVKRFAIGSTAELGLAEWSAHDGDWDPRQICCTSDSDLQTDNSSSSSSLPGWIHLWQQANVTKSRKQVAPLLRGVFSTF